MTVVRRHPLVAFFVLAYALSWCLVPFRTFLPPGPLIAALIVVAIAHGRAGLRELGSRMIGWRVGWIWWVAAVGLPLAVHALTVLLNGALGAPSPSFDQFSPWYAVIMVFALRLINPLDEALGEEPGWRAFAQPRLQTIRSPLLSTSILGILVAGWHLPLLLPSFHLEPIDLLTTVAVTFWYAWLFNHAGGSALITLVAHATEGSINTSELWPAATDLT